MSEILEGNLLLAGLSEIDGDLLEAKKVSAVLSIGCRAEAVAAVTRAAPSHRHLGSRTSRYKSIDDGQGRSLRELHINVLDMPGTDLLREFAGINQFLVASIAAKGGGSVLVHCAQGQSRSATGLAASLIRSLGMSAAAAVRFLLLQRPMVSPNPSFLTQLFLYEGMQRAVGLYGSSYLLLRSAARRVELGLPTGGFSYSSPTFLARRTLYDARSAGLDRQRAARWVQQIEEWIRTKLRRVGGKVPPFAFDPTPDDLWRAGGEEHQETAIQYRQDLQHQLQFSCRGCRTKLFTSSDCVCDTDGSGRLDLARPAFFRPPGEGAAAVPKPPPFMFLCPMGWMQASGLAGGEPVAGDSRRTPGPAAAARIDQAVARAQERVARFDEAVARAGGPAVEAQTSAGRAGDEAGRGQDTASLAEAAAPAAPAAGAGREPSERPPKLPDRWEAASPVEGKLYCPRCGSKVGWWAWEAREEMAAGGTMPVGIPVPTFAVRGSAVHGRVVRSGSGKPKA